MPVLPTPERTWPKFLTRVGSRDRVQSFRLLFLAFGLVTLIGVALVIDARPTGSPGGRVLTALCVVLLSAVWIIGYRRQRFSRNFLPLEAALLVLLIDGFHPAPAAFGVAYLAIQFRAFYGARRDALLMTSTYIGAYLVATELIPDAPAILPIIVVRVMALGLCGYLMHTLYDVLGRDQERASALRRSEGRYRSLFENNPWPMWELDPTTLMFLNANQAAVSQYGYSYDELLRMTIRDLRAPEDLAALERIVPELSSDRTFNHLVRHRKRNGEIIDVEITSQVLEFEGRRARVAIGVDVTERQKVERALRESEQRFRSVAENLREALLITDRDDRITLANARVFDVLGYEPDEVIGKIASDLLLDPSQRHVFQEKLLRRMGGQSEVYETVMTRKGGRRIFAQISASPYRDADGTVIGTLGAISDITDLKRMEERLHQATRMEAVGQLAGGIAHDFNNLLTVIKCHTELMLGELSNNDLSRESVVEIARSANRGATLTQQLLSFSRKQLLRPRRVALANVVAESELMLRRSVSNNVELVIQSDGTTTEVFADPVQLEQVLATLVRNSNDAMPKGGRIVIATRAVELGGQETGWAAESDIPMGTYALLSVSDTGTGMDSAVVARLFEPFFTTKEVGSGTGLGLASLYGVVRQSGGFVDVDSTPNVGTTFRVYLPLESSSRTTAIAAPQVPQLTWPPPSLRVHG